MSLPEIQQALTVLNKSNRVLLLVPEKPSVDAFSSMMALSLALIKTGKQEVHSVSPSHVPLELQFLPGSSQVLMNPQLKPGIIIDIANVTKLVEIKQEQLKGGMRIQLVLEEGVEATADLIETHVRQMPYDVIVIFGASDLVDLGSLFTNHADFFYNTPVINIDHRAANEHFGTINIVDITASSIAEITYELTLTITEQNIDADIATALYAGIVGATQSFQKPSTTPHAFQVAADLMQHQAHTEIVIQQLIKTKPLSLLKLAGRTYARLRHDEHGRLFWSILRELDFVESGSSYQHIPLVMAELTNNISGYNAACILYEDGAKQYTLYVSLGKGLVKRTKEIQEQLGARKENKLLVVSIDAPSLEEAEKRSIIKMQGIIPVFQG